MIKKIYKCIAIIIAINVGINSQSFEEMLYTLLYLFALYIALKIFFAYLRRDIQSAGGPLKWLFSQADTTRYDKQIIRNFQNSFGTSGGAGRNAYDAQREADKRVQNRTKAQKEAAFHQYYANQNKGTYDGYRSQNFANNARNRANRY